MSGLVKPKKYDWKDSNLALFGSDTEKQVKKEAAETEQAWQGSGQEVGLRIWRIVKFKVENWPKMDYGKFYSGDSYIILNTYKNEETEELLYDVHFWIGKYSTQDEYGTAAYKTVELDTFHDDKPIQHREVQGHESNLFKTYFPEGLQLLEGGADTGFRKVTPEEYKPRLLKFQRIEKRTLMTELPLKRCNLHDDDVFILDKGLELYQWNGRGCNKDEKFKATQMIQSIKSERNGRPKAETLDQDSISEDHSFYGNFDGDDVDQEEEEEESDAQHEGDPVLKKVSDNDGTLDLEDVKEGGICREDLCSDDVFILNTWKHVFVWVGSGASEAESKNGLPYAHQYLQGTDSPFLPVTVIIEGKESQSKEFLDSVPGCA